MTSPEPTTQPPAPPSEQPPPQQPQAAPAPSALDNLVASMGMAQLMIVGGALVLVAFDLLFGIILRDYFMSDLVWLGAAAVLVAYFLNRRGLAVLQVRYENILLASAAVIVALGARDLAYSVLFILQRSFNVSAMTYISFIIYAAVVLAVAWGGLQLWRGRKA